MILSLLDYDTDPNAVPNETYFPVVDAALRYIVADMLREASADDESAAGTSIPAAAAAAAAIDPGSSDISGWPKAEVETSLVYLRERVGVPRDMSVHGARMLRAHINKFIAELASSR